MPKLPFFSRRNSTATVMATFTFLPRCLPGTTRYSVPLMWSMVPGASGAMVTGVQQIGGKWYYFESSGAQYKTAGWKQISGKWYYFDEEGVMQTGLQKLDGKNYFFNGCCYWIWFF